MGARPRQGRCFCKDNDLGFLGVVWFGGVRVGLPPYPLKRKVTQ